jgi:hypothetical protein
VIYVFAIILLGFAITGIRSIVRDVPTKESERTKKKSMADIERRLQRDLEIALRIVDPELQEVAYAKARRRYMEGLGELMDE